MLSTFSSEDHLHSYFPILFKEEKEKTEDEDEIIADLLLWAIFVDRKEMAEICWLRGKDHLCKYYTCLL